MEFKVGDRVRHGEYGDGTVIGHHAGISNTVEFDRKNKGFHDGGWIEKGITEASGKEEHCYFVMDYDLTLIAPVNQYVLTITVTGKNVKSRGVATGEISTADVILALEAHKLEILNRASDNVGDADD
ncbi:MAG: hypothetical protein WC547_01160 [Candidatus Omnitrophota bacterium]